MSWRNVFGIRSRATSGRCPIHPDGNRNYNFVATGNLLGARVIVLLLLMSAKSCRWLLEQPANSVFDELPLWRWLLARVTAAGLQCSLNP